MFTDVSPLLNFLSSQVPKLVLKRSQIASTRKGWEDPEKIWTCRILMRKKLGSEAGKFESKNGLSR